MSFVPSAYRLTLAAAVATLPAAALACPTGADLSAGISITFEDGARETYTALRDDLVRMEYAFAGEVEAVMHLALGVYLLSYVPFSDGSPDVGGRVTTSFPGGMGALPRPAAGQRWSETAIVLDRAEAFGEQVTVAWGEPSYATIGDCTYEALEGIIAYDSGDPYFEGMTYMPALGIGYVGWIEDSGGRETYTPTAIEAD